MGWISDKIKETKAQKRYVSPIHANRASEIGHPCLRYLVHLRLDWLKAELPSIQKQTLFDDAKYHEEAVIDTLKEAGIIVLQRQRPFWSEKLQLIGHIDGIILCNDQELPLEIKAINPQDWHQIDKIEDMIECSKVWIRKWPYQMMSYLGLSGQKEGVFVLKNKLTGEIKDFPVFFKEKLWNKIIAICNAVNNCVSARSYPEPAEVEYDKVCRYCPFLTLCVPEALREKGVEIWENSDIEELLNKRERLLPLKKEFDEIEKALKKALEGVDNVIIGSYLIKGKWIERKEYHVPAGRYWKREIIKL